MVRVGHGERQCPQEGSGATTSLHANQPPLPESTNLSSRDPQSVMDISLRQKSKIPTRTLIIRREEKCWSHDARRRRRPFRRHQSLPYVLGDENTVSSTTSVGTSLSRGKLIEEIIKRNIGSIDCSLPSVGDFSDSDSDTDCEESFDRDEASIIFNMTSQDHVHAEKSRRKKKDASNVLDAFTGTLEVHKSLKNNRWVEKDQGEVSVLDAFTGALEVKKNFCGIEKAEKKRASSLGVCNEKEHIWNCFPGEKLSMRWSCMEQNESNRERGSLYDVDAKFGDIYTQDPEGLLLEDFPTFDVDGTSD